MVVALLCLAAPAFAAEPAEGKSLDEQLMDDRDAHSLDPDLDRDLKSLEPEKPSADKRPAPPEPDKKPDAKAEKLKEQLERELGEAAVKEDDNPILRIARRMREVESILEKEADPKTKPLQEDIVAQLDKLLEDARNRSNSPCSGSPSKSKQTDQQKPGEPKQTTQGPKPGGQKPAENPKSQTTQSGGSPKSRPSAADVRELVKRVWGELPEHLRSQVQPSSIEEFLPKYEQLIEAYFKLLADEQRSTPAGSEPKR